MDDESRKLDLYIDSIKAKVKTNLESDRSPIECARIARSCGLCGFMKGSVPDAEDMIVHAITATFLSRKITSL